MKCSAKRLVASSRIVKLIFIDPVLIVVTLQTISVPGKSVSFRGRIVGAAQCGANKIVVLGGDGTLHLLDVNLNKIYQKKVGLPNEWAKCVHTIVVASPTGTTVAFSTKDSDLKVYSVSEQSFEYIGSVSVHEETSNCVITNGLSGSSGLLLAFTPSFVKVVETSPMMPTVSTVRISNDPILYVYPCSQDGDYLLITRHRVQTFCIRDVLVGRFEFPALKFPSPLVVASTTRLKNGQAHNMVVCGTKLYELVKSDGRMEAEMLCKLPSFSSPADMTHLFCVSGAGLWLVRWFGRGTRGQFIINQDKEISELDPEYELDFDAKDFVVDTKSNELIGFGLQPNLDFVSNCVALTDLIEPVEAPMITGLLFESEYELLFAIFPQETVVFSMSMSTEGIKLMQIHTFEGKVLAVGSSKGICTCVFEDKRVFIAQYSFVVMGTVPFDSLVSAASILNDTAVISTIDGTVSLVSLNSLDTQPEQLFGVGFPLCTLRWANQNVIVYAVGGDLIQFNMEKKTHTPAYSSQETQIHDFISHRGKYYVGTRDGIMVEAEGPTSTSRTRLDDYPVGFIDANEHLVARGAGLWIIQGENPIPIVRKENNRNESLSQVNIAGACVLPFADFCLMVAYDNTIRILATEDIRALMSKPQVYSLSLKNPASSIKEGKRFRVWAVCSDSGLSFFDTKHRTAIKTETDISTSEKISEIAFWDIELDGKTYTHLALGTSRTTPEGETQYWLRSCSVKRDRNVVVVKKRLKLELEKPISRLVPYQGDLLVISANRVQPVQLKKESGLTMTSVNLTVEGLVTDFSINGKHGYLSTLQGLVKADFDSFIAVNQTGHMVNRMRECTCHLVLNIKGKEIVLVGQRDCFLQVLELVNGIWRIVQRLDAPERILRMQVVEGKAISSQSTVAVALTTNGSFVELKFTDQAQQVETGPYLF